MLWLEVWLFEITNMDKILINYLIKLIKLVINWSA